MPASSRIVYSARPKPKRPISWRAVLTFLGLPALALSGLGLLYVVNLPVLRIGRVEVRGVRQVPAAEVEAAARTVIAGKAWGLLPNDSALFVSVKSVERELRSRFPTIDAVRVSRAFPQRLLIDIQERPLWGVYCERPFSGGPPRACSYLDRRGTAYTTFAHFEGWLLPVIYGSAPAALGGSAVSPVMLAFFDDAARAVAGLGGGLLALTLASSTPEDARLVVAEGWQIWVNPSRPVGEWLGALTAVLEQEIGERRSSLDYVDLRFGNKVFYKFRPSGGSSGSR